MLTVKNISCHRGDRAIIKACSFTLAPGHMLLLRGPNGCGKTTLLRTLCGLTQPTQGEILWRGQSAAELSEEYSCEILYIGHKNGIHAELTAMENARSFCHYAGAIPTQIDNALKMFGLMHAAHLPTKQLSQGQQRRLALMRLALLQKTLWILDEPLVSLDQEALQIVQKLCAEHLQKNGMIIMASHQDDLHDLQPEVLELGHV